MADMAPRLARGGSIGFFIVHYGGMFWIGRGFVIFLMPVFAERR